MGLLLGRFVEQPVGLCVLFYQIDAACHVRVITKKNGCIKHFIVSMSSYISFKKITSYKQIRLTPFVFFFWNCSYCWYWSWCWWYQKKLDWSYYHTHVWSSACSMSRQWRQQQFYTHSPEMKDNMHYSVSVCVHTQKIQIVKKYYLAILSCVENFLKRMDAWSISKWAWAHKHHSRKSHNL